MKLKGIEPKGAPIPPEVLGALVMKATKAPSPSDQNTPTATPKTNDVPTTVNASPASKSASKTLKPRKPSSAQKLKPILAKFSPGDYEAIAKAASALGITPTEYVREAALRKSSEMLADVLLFIETAFEKAHQPAQSGAVNAVRKD